ncbi:LysR family transcriptional regulator [uncultured Sulfitobacter sp.]|uniref:LysR family transcriptional regulator n=1 Tax=uncultured Sulfitobacter sp. TaxID=191468 RepID=UPI002632C93B|nr:LysR family transcriptional regulator [uncultured Sulfitobacter sp.]
MYDLFTIGTMSQSIALSLEESQSAVTSPPALLFEIMRSFVTLARTLNLSHAVKELGSTRQTLRRHVSALEEIKGGPLFSVSERRYELTELGLRILPEAEHLLAQAEGWVVGAASQLNGLQYLSKTTDEGWMYFQQQQPIGKAFSSTSSMLPACVNAWAEARGDIEHPAMKAIRPKCMTFRRSEANWIFTEVGEESSFRSWFGWTMAQSTIGRSLGQLPGGTIFDHLVNLAYVDVETSQSVRLDHCYTKLFNEEKGEPVPICYERLLLGSRFADGSFAMVSTVRRTYDIEIEGVTDEMLRLMPERYLM